MLRRAGPHPCAALFLWPPGSGLSLWRGHHGGRRREARRRDPRERQRAGKRCCVSRACLCTGQQYPPNDDYFRACVLPLAATKPEYQRAANKYAANCDLKPMEQRFCECGQPLAARARMCAKCKAVKRRTTVREAVRLRRKAACKQLTPISAPQVPGVQGDKFRNSQGCYPPTGPIAVS
jgi:hypothetical protein